MIYWLIPLERGYFSVNPLILAILKSFSLMKSITPLVTDLMGRKLRTPQGEEIGVVQNVMLNPSDGTIIFIFLCYANFIGKVHRHFAIPRQQLRFKKDGGSLYFEIDEHRLKDASELNVTGKSRHLYNKELEHIYELHAEEEILEPKLAG